MDKRISKEEMDLVQEDYGRFVKVVVDIEQRILAAGGEWHVDGETVLLERGSKQKNLWGGGINLDTGEIIYTALINMRPALSRSQEVLDLKTREIMEGVIKDIFGYE